MTDPKITRAAERIYKFFRDLRLQNDAESYGEESTDLLKNNEDLREFNRLYVEHVFTFKERPIMEAITAKIITEELG